VFLGAFEVLILCFKSVILIPSLFIIFLFHQCCFHANLFHSFNEWINYT
jgi:hypothetical protein